VISFFYVIIPLPHVYHIYYTRTVYLYKNNLFIYNGTNFNNTRSKQITENLVEVVCALSEDNLTLYRPVFILT